MKERKPMQHDVSAHGRRINPADKIAIACQFFNENQSLRALAHLYSVSHMSIYRIINAPEYAELRDRSEEQRRSLIEMSPHRRAS